MTDLLSEFIKTMRAVLKSVLKYPTCVFWLDMFNPLLMDFSLAFVIYFMESDSDITFPLLEDVADHHRFRRILTLSHIFGFLTHLIVLQFMRQYGKRKCRTAAGRAVRKITNGVTFGVITSLIANVFDLSVVLLKKEMSIRSTFSSLFYLLSPISFIAFSDAIGIVEGTTKPNGFYLDYIAIVTGVSSTICHTFAVCSDSYTSLFRLISRLSMSVRTLLLGFEVFGDRFVKV